MSAMGSITDINLGERSFIWHANGSAVLHRWLDCMPWRGSDQSGSSVGCRRYRPPTWPALMHRDEEATHAKLTAPLVAPHHGSAFCLSFATLTVFLHKIYAFDFTLAKTRLSLRRTGADGQSF